MTTYRHIVWTIGFITYLTASGPSQPTASPGTSPWVMATFPFLTHPHLEAVFAPMARALSDSLGIPVEYHFSSSYERFMEGLSRQEYDLAFIQPFDYVRTGIDAGYVPLVRRSPYLRGVLVIHPDSALVTVEALAGKTIAAPPAPAAVSLLGKLFLLSRLPNKEFHWKHLSSHESALLLLLSGGAQAALVAPAPLRFFEARMNVRFSRLAFTDSIPGALFVAHSRIPVPLQGRIRRILLHQRLSPAAEQLFGKGTCSPFCIATEEEYRQVQRYWRFIEQRRLFPAPQR
ncbi:MAG: hypothetical protein D6681_05235 [Calditrichaeota bacterium]|nr:MAG: hypothetical protein D6681_05235 [Calditrichota bacterium]